MPLANGDLVAVRSPGNAPGTYIDWMQYQPPAFGIVANAAGVVVLWENGRYTAVVVAGQSLDKIRPGFSDRLGHVVRIDNNPTAALQPSAAFDAVVVMSYSRQRNGDGTIGPGRLLCKLLSNGAWIEVSESSTRRLEDR
jgi:hypothetical protein